MKAILAAAKKRQDRSQRKVVKRTKFGIELEEGANEILAQAKGETKLAVRRIVLPDDVDVRLIRT